MKVITNSLRKYCRCDSQFSSCAIKNCWRSINNFAEIGYEIRQMYDRSILLSYNNNIRIDTNIREDSLVFVFGKVFR